MKIRAYCHIAVCLVMFAADRAAAIDGIELASEVARYLETTVPTAPGERREISVQPLDRRLHLTDCSSPLVFEPHSNPRSARTSVRVRCPSEGWQVYVPAKIRRWQSVVVTRVPLLRDHVLGPEDVTLEEYEVSAIRGRPHRDLERVLGMRLLRDLDAGAAITARYLAPPVLVHRQRPVTIVTRRGAVAVSASGTALSDGTAGSRIKVRNERSGRVLFATVTGPDLVTIGAP